MVWLDVIWYLNSFYTFYSKLMMKIIFLCHITSQYRNFIEIDNYYFHQQLRKLDYSGFPIYLSFSIFLTLSSSICQIILSSALLDTRLKDDTLNHVKIADFGLSEFYRPGGTISTQLGTLSFLAPETFTGSNYPGKTDTYLFLFLHDDNNS